MTPLTQGKEAYEKRSAELGSRERKRAEQEKRRRGPVTFWRRPAAMGGEVQRQAEQAYDKWWGEATARRRPTRRSWPPSSLRPGRRAAKKLLDSVPADQGATDAGEAGKKPSATASGEEAPPATGTEKRGT